MAQRASTAAGRRRASARAAGASSPAARTPPAKASKPKPKAAKAKAAAKAAKASKPKPKQAPKAASPARSRGKSSTHARRPTGAGSEPRGIVAALSARRARRAAQKGLATPDRRGAPRRAPTQGGRSRSSVLLAPLALVGRMLPGGRIARIALALILLVGLGSIYQFWLRDSSLLAIDEVEVEGLSGPDGPAIAATLTKSAEGMTTLNADPDALERSVAGFPVVRGVDIDTGLPNSATIIVTETPPAMVARVDGDEDSDVPVAADGTVLPGASTDGLDLPVMNLAEAPSGDELADAALEQALVIGRAPKPLRPLIETVDYSTGEGVTIGLEGGVRLEFGAAERAASKWDSASAVMADPDLTQLASIDLRVPDRPAVG